MVRRSVRQLNKDLRDFIARWFDDIIEQGRAIGGIDNGVNLYQDGVGFMYFFPYHLSFSEDKGDYCFNARVSNVGRGLQEAIEKEQTAAEEESPSAKKIDAGPYFTKRHISENGNCISVKFRVKRFPENINDLFDYAKWCVIKPLMRVADRTRHRR